MELSKPVLKNWIHHDQHLNTRPSAYKAGRSNQLRHCREHIEVKLGIDPTLDQYHILDRVQTTYSGGIRVKIGLQYFLLVVQGD